MLRSICLEVARIHMVTNDHFQKDWVFQRDIGLCMRSWQKRVGTVLNFKLASQMLDMDKNSKFSLVANITILCGPIPEL